MDKKDIKVAIYARVSTQEQATEGTSLDHQTEQLEAYCQFQGWQITGKYIDPGFTGKDGERPGLKTLLSDAKLGVFNKVVVYKLDRLARKLRLLLEIEEKLKDNDVSLISVKETLDTSTAIGRTVFQMLGLVGEWERETIIERTISGRMQRYKEGKWGAGAPAYGYTYNSETKSLDINEEEARIIRRIFDDYFKGRSMWEIANQLNNDKIPTRRNGKGWRNTSIRDILINPVYKGNQIVNYRKGEARTKGKDYDTLPKDAIVIPVPAIIDEGRWNIVQERRKNNKHRQPTKTNEWLLQGLISCGLCGYAYQSQITHGKRRYGCRGRLKYTHLDGSPRCTAPRINADWIEQQVWQRIEDIINDPNKLEKLLNETVESLREREAELNARIQPINTRLDEITEQKTRLAEEWVIGSLSPERIQELKTNLDQEQTRLRNIRNEIDPAQIEELERTSTMLRFWESQLQSLAWDTETEDGQKVRLVDKPHKVALSVIGLEDKDLAESLSFPTTKRKILDLLQVRLVVFTDRVEVKSVFPIEPLSCQLLSPIYK
ncbi:MAG: recombinase family protein [Dehalococcoidales bacterium]|nr:recombinase family protein [Dehalococcoidales bacterium]